MRIIQRKRDGCDQAHTGQIEIAARALAKTNAGGGINVVDAFDIDR